MFREDLDDESYQVREVYAQFGLTSYAAQVMERGVINLLAMFANINDSQASATKFDQHYLRYAAMTLGVLIKELKKHFAQEVDTFQALDAALPLRNAIAHNFFWDKSIAFTVSAGRESMLAELIEMLERFRETDRLVEELLIRVGVEAGGLPKHWQEALDAQTASLKAEADAIWGSQSRAEAP